MSRTGIIGLQVVEAGKGQRSDAGTNLTLDVDHERFCFCLAKLQGHFKDPYPPTGKPIPKG